MSNKSEMKWQENIWILSLLGPRIVETPCKLCTFSPENCTYTQKPSGYFGAFTDLSPMPVGVWDPMLRAPSLATPCKVPGCLMW